MFRLVLGYLLVAKKENLTGILTGLTGRSKNFDPTGFHLWCSFVLVADRSAIDLIAFGSC